MLNDVIDILSCRFGPAVIGLKLLRLPNHQVYVFVMYVCVCMCVFLYVCIFVYTVVYLMEKQLN